MHERGMKMALTWMKTIEQERAEAEAFVKDMELIGKVHRIECSMYINKWDDPDMDTTETLYQDSNGKYYLRVEMYHAFITSDGVDRIGRKQATDWLRENARAAFVARKRKRMVHRVKPFVKAVDYDYADAVAECEHYVLHSENIYDENW